MSRVHPPDPQFLLSAGETKLVGICHVPKVLSDAKGLSAKVGGMGAQAGASSLGEACIDGHGCSADKRLIYRRGFGTPCRI